MFVYQYKNLSKQSANYWNGNLALILSDKSEYNISSPVNKLINYEENQVPFIVEDTLSNQES